MARAVLMLMARSNLTGCSTGKSPGLAPCRILSTRCPQFFAALSSSNR
jgi:hypothetical protein